MMKPIMIVPTILTNSFAELKEQLAKIEGIFPSVHIDVMDGKFVDNFSFAERDELIGLNTTISLELHLMVDRPLVELEAWKKIPNVRNVIFHIESADDPVACIEAIRNHGWHVGLALNPETPLSKTEPYILLIDEIMFMTVHPGHQGSPFVPAVMEKIKTYVQSGQQAVCAVDGAVSTKTIGRLTPLGVQKFCVGSALLKADNIQEAHAQLLQAANP